MDVVVRRVHLDRSGARVRLTAILTAEPPQVHLPQVEARLAIDDPFGHRCAHPSGAGDAVGAESRRDVETANRGLAQQEFIVRRERFRSIDQLDDITLFQRRDPRDGVLRERHEARPVLWQESVVEVGCDAGKTPRRRIALIATHHQAAGIAAEIDEQVGVAHGGQILGDRFGNARDQVLVCHRDEWHG